jgi:hypothetical protein
MAKPVLSTGDDDPDVLRADSGSPALDAPRQLKLRGDPIASSNKHAAKHFRAIGHPIIRSFEPGEARAWCDLDEVFHESA